MDIINNSSKHEFRKIEDIIDLQKAKGNINVQQVTLFLPLRGRKYSSAKCYRTGLSKTKLQSKMKKTSKLHRRELSDVTSWSSESDITVFKMKLNSKNRKSTSSNLFTNSLYHTDCSSMVNLATMILKSQTASEPSSAFEEYLLPLSSWEHATALKTCKEKKSKLSLENTTNNSTTEIHKTSSTDNVDVFDNNVTEECRSRSKVVNFMRHCFCPCSRRLYKTEKPNKQLTVETLLSISD